MNVGRGYVMTRVGIELLGQLKILSEYFTLMHYSVSLYSKSV